MARVEWAWFLGLVCIGCVGGGAAAGSPGQPAAQFPSRTALDAVVAKPVSPKAQGAVVDAPSWDMQPVSIAPSYPQENTWDQLFVEALAESTSVHPSAELRCAAREVARFWVEQGGSPDDGVRRHVLTRCGSTITGAGWGQLTVTIPDNVSDAELERQLRPQVADYVHKNLLGRPGEVGLGFARGHGRAAWVGYMGQPRVRLSGFSPLVTGGSVVLDGELLSAAAGVTAMVNQGQYGVARCELDTTLALPRFRASCPLLEQDGHSLIQIATRTQGQVLMIVVAELEVRRDDSADLGYDAGAYGDNQLTPTPDAFGASLLAIQWLIIAVGLRRFASREARA
jgi:hypothetical protein